VAAAVLMLAGALILFTSGYAKAASSRGRTIHVIEHAVTDTEIPPVAARM
jgi:hypothetical protein